MRQNSALVIIIALLVAVGLGIGAYLYLSNSTTPADQLGGTQPTAIPEPDIQILEAASDIPANRLITGADREALFLVTEVRPSEVTDNDVRADEFSSIIQGQVTKAAIRGGDRIKKDSFRSAGVAELIPTAVPGQSARKAMTVFVNDLGNIAADGNTADIVASYNVTSFYLQFTGVTPEGVVTLEPRDYPDVTTKVIGQNIPILKVIAPPIVAPEGGAAAPAAEPQPAPAEGGVVPPAAPTAEPVFAQGSQWQVVLAVTDQEAELIEYTKAKIGILSLIIRRADDQEIVETSGVTMDLLMRLYGVNQAYAQPNMLVDLLDAPPPPQPPGQPPVVIPVPVPFGGGAPVPLPTALPAATPTP